MKKPIRKFKEIIRNRRPLILGLDKAEILVESHRAHCQWINGRGVGI